MALTHVLSLCQTIPERQAPQKHDPSGLQPRKGTQHSAPIVGLTKPQFPHLSNGTSLGAVVRRTWLTLVRSSAQRPWHSGYLPSADMMESKALQSSEPLSQSCRWWGPGVCILGGCSSSIIHQPAAWAAGRQEEGKTHLTRPRFRVLLSSSGMGRYTARATQLAKMVSKMMVSKGLV